MTEIHGTPWRHWLLTTDHKKIGLLYLWTSFVFFLAAGVAALVMRWELAQPGKTVIDPALYYMLFSFHGTTMIFLWIIPVLVGGFGNFLLPLLIGAPDMAYPRLNGLSYWTYLAGGILLYVGFFFGINEAYASSAAVGWTGYPPLSGVIGSPGSGVDFYILGIHLLGVSSMMGAINFIVTILRMRKPGVTFHNMSLFVWAQFTTAILIVFATPWIGTAMMLNFFDRNFGTNFFTAAGDPELYQHIFWFYSHPAVYVMILPAMGIVSEVLPRMVRRPIFGYKAMAYSILAIAFLGFTVWAHHMFTTTMPYQARLGFMIMTMIIGVPTGVKFFNWIFTMYGGHLRFEAPLLFCVGFIAMFLIGGIDGVFMASVPVDYQLHDTYWPVSHLHYVLFGGSVLGVFAGLYYWWPRFTGRMYNRSLAKWHFWVTLVGLNVVFMTMHFLGTAGMPRRVYDYRDIYATMNLIATVGAFLVAAGQLPFLANVWWSVRNGMRVHGDPWNDRPTIEWKGFKALPGGPVMAHEARRWGGGKL
ncbi:MAG TPA: cbb3-type cytochrome c oxidase subunit I [Candidatus Thermoplasmatota archaeon]|nr:cbb3-type cytochrome c oxidase subunit I [Candidatus Thermoplasmatota archaeon]